MFDVSFVELMVIGVVALVVLGPEKLPGAARTVGGYLRKARQSWASVKAEFEREIAADEIKRSVDKVKRSIDPREPYERSATPASTATGGATGTEVPPPPATPATHAPHD